jgi:tRNA nucleotidyltransferase (CCA-adding enzyme)
LILGRHLVQLGLAPGPEFKSIIEDCAEAQLEGAFTDEAGGVAWLQEHLRKGGK